MEKICYAVRSRVLPENAPSCSSQVNQREESRCSTFGCCISHSNPCAPCLGCLFSVPHTVVYALSAQYFPSVLSIGLVVTTFAGAD